MQQIYACVLLLNFLLYQQLNYAQNLSKRAIPSKRKITALFTTDTIPEFGTSKAVNYKAPRLSLASLRKNKLLIIDFFATTCSPCIAMLPKLDSLQQRYKEEILIIPVTSEKSTIISNFLKTNKNAAHIQLPFITEDTILSQQFPHFSIPHEVWIDKNGIVKAITSHHEITEKNIKGVIAGILSSLPEKKDDIAFSIEKSLLVDNNGGDSKNFLFRSLLTAYNPGLNSKTSITRQGKGLISRIICTNTSIVGLYYLAYTKYKFPIVNRTRLRLATPDSAVYFPPVDNYPQWEKKYDFCYELILPHGVPDSIFFSYMLNDLNRYFKIKAKIEKQEVLCWALKPLTDSLLLDKIFDPNSASKFEMSFFIRYLNQFRDIDPVINETGYNKDVSINLDFFRKYSINQYPDLAAFKSYLNTISLDLVKVKREIDILKMTESTYQ